jgi:hypothetical protein
MNTLPTALSSRFLNLFLGAFLLLWGCTDAPESAEPAEPAREQHAQQSEPKPALGQQRVALEEDEGGGGGPAIAPTGPDSTAPALDVDGASTRSTDADSAPITGTVTDPGSGVASVTVQNARYAGQTFGAVVESNDRFSAEVPLAVGDNVLTVRATDRAANATQTTVTVTLVPSTLPRLTILTPAASTRTDAEHVALTGRVRSSIPPQQIRLVVGSQVTFPTGSGSEYTFGFDNVPLAKGANTLSVRAETAYGNVVAQVLVYRDAPEDAASRKPPVVLVQGASSEVYVAGASFPVNGTVTATRCVTSVTVNGLSATLTGSGTSVSFRSSLSFAAGSDTLPVSVEAVDCDGEHTVVAYTARRDVTAPVLTVDNLQLAPAVNTVGATPHTITGTISELHLASLTANAQGVGVLPGGSAGSYVFSVALPLVRATTRDLELVARDFAGNQATLTVRLALDAQLDLTLVSPIDGARYLTNSGPASVEVIARVPGLAPTDRVLAIVDSGTPVVLTVASGTARGSVAVAEGNHRVSVRVENAQNAAIATSSAQVVVENAEDVALAVLSSEPANGAAGVEPNVTPALFFSKPIVDPAKLALRVMETVHGHTYASPVLGASGPEQGKLQVREVNRDRELRRGSLLVGQTRTSALFEPQSELAYGAKIEVEAYYDEEPIGKVSFQVRPNPTLFAGTVLDHLGEPASNVEVMLAPLGRTTKTDLDGSFTFGFGEPFEKHIPGGSYRLLVNPGASDTRYGSAEQVTSFQEGRLNEVSAVRVPIVHPEIPYRQVDSGASNTLDNARFTLDLTNAELTFADGNHQGPMHVQPLMPGDGPYASAPLATPEWVYSFTPHDVRVRGQVRVDLPLLPRDGSFEYFDTYSDRVLFVALDLTKGLLAVVGAGRIDRAAQRVRSERLELGFLNMIGYRLVPPAHEAAVDKYLTGESSLRELTSTLSGEP